MPSLRCEHCGRRTIIRTTFGRSVTSAINSEVRICLEHGEAWQEQQEQQEAPR